MRVTGVACSYNGYQMSLMASSCVDGKKNIDIVRAEKTVMRQHTRRDQTYPPVVRVPENPILFRNKLFPKEMFPEKYFRFFLAEIYFRNTNWKNNFPKQISEKQLSETNNPEHKLSPNVFLFLISRFVFRIVKTFLNKKCRDAPAPSLSRRVNVERMRV